MTLAYNEDNSDQWKNDLHKKAIEILLGNNSNENYEQIGYAYLCYAQNYIYKYFPDDIDRFNAIKENKMRYSAPINFNDVFDCDFSEDFESIFNSVLKQAPYGTIIRKNSKKWIELRGTIKKALALFHQTMDLWDAHWQRFVLKYILMNLLLIIWSCMRPFLDSCMVQEKSNL